jgi:CspA family cold shock protein
MRSGASSPAAHLASTCLERPPLPRELRSSMQGTIKRVIRDRGFGFIRSAEGQEVFFHRSGLQNLNFDSLKEGDNVEFELERGEKGPRAVNVRAAQ